MHYEPPVQDSPEHSGRCALSMMIVAFAIYFPLLDSHCKGHGKRCQKTGSIIDAIVREFQDLS